MPLDLPVLKTKRLELYRLDAPTALQLFEAWPAEELSVALHCPNAAVFDGLRDRFYTFAVHCRRITMLSWLIRRRDTGTLIGDCGFHLVFPRHQKAELGYSLYLEENWGYGFMKEAIPQVLAYGFGEMELHRIEAYTAIDNLASLALLRRFGFRREGLARRHYFDGEEGTDSFAFALLREEFQEEPAGMSSTEKLIRAFEGQLLAAASFGHQEHLTVALWYVHRYGETEAIGRLRAGLLQFLWSIGAKSEGQKMYHETLTIFWVKALQGFIRQLDGWQGFEELLRQLLGSPLADSSFPNRYYSKGLLSGKRARACWVPPDLKPLD